jgi:hypothetical protein
MLNEFGKLIGDFTIAKAGRRALLHVGIEPSADLPNALVRAASLPADGSGRHPAARHELGRPAPSSARARANCFSG